MERYSNRAEALLPSIALFLTRRFGHQMKLVGLFKLGMFLIVL
jgi:hypothetical protein